MLIALMILGLMLAMGLPAVAEGGDPRTKSPKGEDKKFWRMARNAAVDGQPATAEIHVFGYLASDWWDAWMPDDTYPLKFAEDLKALGDVDEIHLRINSLGGDVFCAYTISAMLREHAARVVAHIDGVAASAATILALASANEVTMPANANFLIHLPVFSRVSGNENDLRAYADELATLKEGLIAIYEAKTGMERDELIALMEKDSYMTAKQAHDLGFVDTITSPIPVQACASPGRYRVNNTEMDFRGARVWPEQMLAEAEQAEEAGSEAVEEPESSEDGSDGTDGNPEPEPEPTAKKNVNILGTIAAGQGKLAAGALLNRTADGKYVVATAADFVAVLATDADATSEAQTMVFDPEVSAEIENKRVADVMALSRPGAEEIIAAAIKDGSSPGDVALKILHSDSVRNADMLAARMQDAKGGKVNDVAPGSTIMEPLTNAEQQAVAKQIADAASAGR